MLSLFQATLFMELHVTELASHTLQSTLMINKNIPRLTALLLSKPAAVGHDVHIDH